jgi:OPT family oligopeptide transporter
MASASANAPIAIDVLATETLYYSKKLTPALGIFLILASQCLGYGIAGLLRKILVYPTKMLYPYNLPMNTLLEALHGDKKETKKKLRVFYIGFICLFFYEIIPQWIMPVLLGVSFFCLAKRDSMLFTNLFGGSNGNEGLGILSLSFDWQYISNPSPLWYPLQTLFNSFVGYIICIFVFVGVFYTNIWSSQKFPFLSQLLYSEQSNGTHYVEYNQSAVLNHTTWEVDDNLVAAQGLPYFTGTFALYILATNLSITSTFTHLLLWNYDDIKAAWAFLTPAGLKKVIKPHTWNWRFWQADDTQWGGPKDMETDPHYRLMLNYKDSPNWWYGLILILSLVIGLITTYKSDSTLPWWAFLISCGLSAICILFFGAQYAITGYDFNIQPVIQMLAGYLRPKSPIANMYFVLFGYNSVRQGQLLLRDLKFAQYAHLSPRATFTMQMVSFNQVVRTIMILTPLQFGTVVGAVFSYIMTDLITTNQRDVLLSIEGTSTWSGQSIQTFNSQAIAWGGFVKPLFSVGARYQWISWSFLIGFALPVPFWIGHKFFPKLRMDYLNTAVISSFIGLLNVGINSVTLAWFIVGAFSQFYLRRYRPNWFIKYNYILSAALDGGTQVIVFILSFAVFGGSGAEVSLHCLHRYLKDTDRGVQHKFPAYWGNNFQNGYYDFCMKDPALGKGSNDG